MWVKARPRFLCLKQELYPDKNYFCKTRDMGSTASSQRPPSWQDHQQCQGPSLGSIVSQAIKDHPPPQKHTQNTEFPEDMRLLPLITDLKANPEASRNLEKPRGPNPTSLPPSMRMDACMPKAGGLCSPGTGTTRLLLVTHPEL